MFGFLIKRDVRYRLTLYFCSPQSVSNFKITSRGSSGWFAGFAKPSCDPAVSSAKQENDDDDEEDQAECAAADPDHVSEHRGKSQVHNIRL